MGISQCDDGVTKCASLVCRDGLIAIGKSRQIRAMPTVSGLMEGASPSVEQGYLANGSRGRNLALDGRNAICLQVTQSAMQRASDTICLQVAAGLDMLRARWRGNVLVQWNEF